MALIAFYKPSRLFSQTNEEWGKSRTGGTTVTNTTFPELVKMVKEDCSQFQKSKGNHTDETINWSYSAYTPEPELSQEEEFEEMRKELLEDLKGELDWIDETELKYVEDTYGITKRSMDKEFIEWFRKGLEDGYFSVEEGYMSKYRDFFNGYDG